MKSNSFYKDLEEKLLKEDKRNDSYIKKYLNELNTNIIKPIETKKKVLEWYVEENPRRLKKIIRFEKYKELKLFLKELLNYEEKIFHNAKIILDGLEITLEVWTRKIDDITSLDRDYSKFVDELYYDMINQ